jgi:DNA-binding transcriptional ArsR family regulator
MQAFAALADSTRRHIVELLAEREYVAGDLVERFSLSQPAVSQHLKVLRDAGLVRVRRDAQRRMYALEPQASRKSTTVYDPPHVLEYTWNEPECSRTRNQP